MILYVVNNTIFIQIQQKLLVITMGFIEILIQVMPHLVVFTISRYIVKSQQKRAKSKKV